MIWNYYLSPRLFFNKIRGCRSIGQFNISSIPFCCLWIWGFGLNNNSREQLCVHFGDTKTQMKGNSKYNRDQVPASLWSMQPMCVIVTIFSSLAACDHWERRGGGGGFYFQKMLFTGCQSQVRGRGGGGTVMIGLPAYAMACDQDK